MYRRKLHITSPAFFCQRIYKIFRFFFVFLFSLKNSHLPPLTPRPFTVDWKMAKNLKEIKRMKKWRSMEMYVETGQQGVRLLYICIEPLLLEYNTPRRNLYIYICLPLQKQMFGVADQARYVTICARDLRNNLKTKKIYTFKVIDVPAAAPVLPSGVAAGHRSMYPSSSRERRATIHIW